VGEGDRTAELRALVEREGWTCVKFWPYLPTAEFAALLHWADFGLVALEPSCLGLMSPSKMHAWLAAGKPIIYIGPIGSNVSETLDAFGCGFVVDPAQPDSFQRVAEALTSVDVLSHMHLQSQIAWKTRHSPEVGLKAWWELLSQVQDNRRHGRSL
jgi:glycosyltransferase involved in cell wall biosynthesis